MRNKFNEYLTSLNISPTTQSTYKSAFKNYEKVFNGNHEQSYADLCSMLEQKQVNHDYMVLNTRLVRRFLKYIGVNTQKLVPMESVVYRRKPLTMEELQKVLQVSQGRVHQEIVMLLGTGCRIGELSQVRYSDINWEKKSIIVHGKGDKYRIIPLTDGLIHYLDNEIEIREKRPCLWYGNSNNSNYRGKPLSSRSIQMDISQLGKLCHVTLNPHTFRHQYATLMNKWGMNRDVLSLITGHENNSTIDYYIHDDEDVLEVMFKEFSKVEAKLDDLLFGKYVPLSTDTAQQTLI